MILSYYSHETWNIYILQEAAKASQKKIPLSFGFIDCPVQSSWYLHNSGIRQIHPTRACYFPTSLSLSHPLLTAKIFQMRPKITAPAVACKSSSSSLGLSAYISYMDNPKIRIFIYIGVLFLSSSRFTCLLQQIYSFWIKYNEIWICYRKKDAYFFG